MRILCMLKDRHEKIMFLMNELMQDLHICIFEFVFCIV